MDGGERTDGETREAWKKGWESHFVDVDAQITRVQSTNSFEPSERRGEGSCDPLTCRYTRAAPASKFHGAIDFARDNDRILARRKPRVEFDFLFFFFRRSFRFEVIWAIFRRIETFSYQRDFLVRTVAALCNSTLTRVVGITIREKFTAFTRGRDKILRDPRVKKK